MALGLAVTTAKILGPAVVGGLGGLGFSLGMGAGALQTAPQVAYQQAYQFSQGYGAGMTTGQIRNAYMQRYLDAYYRPYDLQMKMANKLFDWHLDQRLREMETSYSSSKYSYRLTV